MSYVEMGMRKRDWALFALYCATWSLWWVGDVCLWAWRKWKPGKDGG